MDQPGADSKPAPLETAAPAHDAFISYSRRDRAFAALLEKSLKAYRPPNGIGAAQRYLTVFRDESDFTGTEYFAAIDTQLRQSRKLIVLCSPAARGSRFVDDEVRRFIQARSSADVIPLLLAGVPNNEVRAGQEDQMAFPQALCDALQMPLATSYLGLDPKRDKITKDRFEGAWYTLLANIFDVRRSEIEQRDRKRQARRRRIFGTAAGLVIVVLSAALAFAVVSRNEAVAQRQVALAEKAEAQRQRDIAEERRRAALARQLNVAAEAVLGDGAEGARLSLLLSVESLHANWTAEGHQALLAHIDLVPRPPEALGHPHLAPVRALAVSPDGEWIASEAEDGTAVWDRAARHEIRRLPPTGRGQRRALAFSPDRRWLVASCQPAAGCVWDTSTWTIAAPLQRAAMLQSAEFSPDGRLLATVARGSSEVQLRETATWRLLPSLGAEGLPNQQVSGLTFSPNGRWIATQQQAGVAVWDIAGRRQIGQVESASSVGRTLAFSPDGRWLVAIDNQGELAMWGVRADAAGKVRLVAEPNWHTPKINPRVTPAFNRDGTRLAIGLHDGGISVLSLAGRREISRIAQAAETLAFEPNGAAALIVGHSDGRLAVWPQDAPETLRLPHSGAATRLALSADGRWLATIDRERILRVFDSVTRRQIAQPEPAEEGAEIDFSGDGRWLLVTADHVVRVFDTSGWTEVLRHRSADWITGQVMLTPDGAWLVVAGGARVYRYAAGSWRESPPIEVQGSAFFASPDGRHLATHSQWSFARGLGLLSPSMTQVWDMTSGEPLAWLSHEAEDLRQSVFGGLGRAPNASGPWTTATAGGDQALAQAAPAWPRLRTLAEARSAPNRPWLAAIDARGETLATAYVERAQRAHGGKNAVSTFSADGRWLASSGSDGSLRLWLIPTADVIAEACTRIARNLSQEEWKRHFGNETYRRTCPNLPPAGDR